MSDSVIIAFELWWDRGCDPDDQKAIAFDAYLAGYAQAEADAAGKE